MDKIIDFTLVDTNNEKVTLRDLLAKQNILLLFYRGSWWAAWSQRLSRVRQDYQEIRKTNTEVVTISVDSPKVTKEFREKLNLPFIMLSDEDLDVIKSYNTLDSKEREDGFISLVATFIFSKDSIIYQYISKDHWDDVPSNEIILKKLKKLN